MPQNICFKCYINFEEVYDMFLLCYVCRKYFCIACYHKHHHNNTETQYENLFNIIMEKNNTLYKPLPICDWNTSSEVDHAIAMERMMNRYIVRQRCDFISFYRQLGNIKERFNYSFIEMIFKKLFCHDIIELILRFV